MHEPQDEAGAGAYLVGHGTYRNPRLIELQWMRIQRYRNLLGTKYERRWRHIEVYADVNFPRADRITEQAFPAYFRLLRAVEEGRLNLVYLDIEIEIGTTQYYGWAPKWLEESGARVVNAFYDGDAVLSESLALRYRGQADPNEIDDASDFVAFFPALSSRVTRAALRSVLHLPGCQQPCSANDLWAQLGRLRDRSPYAAGREPFIQEELETEWADLRYKLIESERSKRRESETLFRLAPAGAGLLVDEYPSSEMNARTSEELLWAEKRIQSELHFKKVVDGCTIAYTRDVDDCRIFADTRTRGRITFYSYMLPRDSNKQDLSSCSFHLQDRFSRKLAEKWNDAFVAAVQIRR